MELALFIVNLLAKVWTCLTQIPCSWQTSQWNCGESFHRAWVSCPQLVSELRSGVYSIYVSGLIETQGSCKPAPHGFVPHSGPSLLSLGPHPTKTDCLVQPHACPMKSFLLSPAGSQYPLTDQALREHLPGVWLCSSLMQKGVSFLLCKAIGEESRN